MATSTLSASLATEGLLEEARKEELLQRIREELERSGPDYQLPRAAYPEDRQHPGALSPGAKGSKGSTGGKRHGRRGTQNRYRANAPDRAPG